jgi:hypothetical protein
MALMQEAPRRVQPLDYRPSSEDAAARQWPLWAGLVVVMMFAAVLMHLIRSAAPPAIAPPPPPPLTLRALPTAQPILVVPAAATQSTTQLATRPALDLSPGQ